MSSPKPSGSSYAGLAAVEGSWMPMVSVDGVAVGRDVPVGDVDVIRPAAGAHAAVLAVEVELVHKLRPAVEAEEQTH